jgi:cyclopropane-fatty-acyl-phospholipid synthase
MRNWRELLRRVATWLAPDGRAFVHVFSHRTLPYRFVGTWAAARFFTAGLMPSHELMFHFAEDLRVADSWIVPGTHYARTLRAWRERLDANAGEALAVLRASERSPREARRLLATWRLFLHSTEVIWGYRGGDRWLVSHYLLEPRRG